MYRAPDVRVHAAPLAHCRHDRREIVVRQHHVRRALGDLCATLSHRAADVRRAQGGSVVDAVARHGGNLAVCLEGAHNPHLMFRRDAGEHVAGAHGAFQIRVRERVQLLPGEHLAVAAQDAQLTGNRGGRGGMVARDHHRTDSGGAALGHSLLHPGARRVRKARKPHKGQVLLHFALRGERVRVAEGHADHPKAGGRHGFIFREEPGTASRAVACQHIRRALADDPVAAVRAAVHRRHALAGGREGNLMHARPAALQLAFFLWAGGGKGCLRRLAPIAARSARAVAAQAGQREDALSLLRMCRHFAGRTRHGAHCHAVFREGAGFVRADDAGAAERFHRRHPPHNALFRRHAPHTHGQHDRHHGGQPLRDSRDGQADRQQEHVKRRRVLQKANEKDQRADGERPGSQPASRLRQTLLQRGFRRLLRRNHSGNASNLCAHACGRHHAKPVACRDLRGGKHHIFPIPERCFLRQHHARVFRGGQALARERAFARAQAVRLNQPQIRRGDIPRAQSHEIARHQLRRVHGFLPASPDDARTRAAQLFQSLHGVLRAALLDHPCHRVEHHDRKDNDGIHIVARALDPRGQKRHRRRREEHEHHKIGKLCEKPREKPLAARPRQLVCSRFLQTARGFRVRKPLFPVRTQTAQALGRRLVLPFHRASTSHVSRRACCRWYQIYSVRARGSRSSSDHHKIS